MTGSFIIGLVGVLATVIFGILSIMLFIRHRYPGKIIFLKETCIDLFDSVVKNFPELSITYKNNLINEQIVLLKGYFINIGSKDISPSMVDEKLCIKLPNKFKWLSVKIISSSSDIKSYSYINDDTNLFFDFGLFRCNEYIKFEALAEVPLETDFNESNKVKPAVKLEKSLEFTHRISDTQKIDQKTYLPYKKENIFQKSHSYVSIALFLVMVIVLIHGSWFSNEALRSSQPKIHYFLDLDSAKTIEIKLTPRGNGTVELKGLNENHIETLNITDFFKRTNWHAQIEVADSSNLIIFFKILSVISLLFLILIFWLILKEYNESKIMKKIESLTV